MNRTEALRIIRAMLVTEEAKLAQAERGRETALKCAERAAYKDRAQALRWAVAGLNGELTAKVGE